MRQIKKGQKGSKRVIKGQKGPKQIKSQLWMFAIGVNSLNIGSVYKVIGCYVECNVVRF